MCPERADLVTYMEYDGVGRDNIHWLPTPIAGNKGAFVDYSTFKSTAISSHASDSRPFTETHYEPSPLNSVDKQYCAGNAWVENPAEIVYQTNIENDVAYYYVYDNHLIKNVEYAANTLYVTKVSDEDKKATFEFKDKLGQVILKRSINDGENIDTYYVYNDFWQLSYVIPLKAVDELTSYDDNNDIMKQLCYLYKYDERGNNIEKRLPGCDPIYMVYDKANRLVLSQDGNQREKTRKPRSLWTVLKYDILGRVVFTGILPNDSTKDQFKAVYSTKLITETYISGTGYSTNYFVTAKPLTLNFYDDYTFTSLAINASNLNWAGSNLNWVNPPTGYDAKYTPPSGVK